MRSRRVRLSQARRQNENWNHRTWNRGRSDGSSSYRWRPLGDDEHPPPHPARTPDAFARAQPILALMGKRVTHVGEAGHGQTAKVANQIIVALTIEAVAE